MVSMSHVLIRTVVVSSIIKSSVAVIYKSSNYQFGSVTNVLIEVPNNTMQLFHKDSMLGVELGDLNFQS